MNSVSESKCHTAFVISVSDNTKQTITKDSGEKFIRGGLPMAAWLCNLGETPGIVFTNGKRD
jgi:hypothetical protein